jgi:cytochrome c5
MLLCGVAFITTQAANAPADQGQQIFRFDTFGDEQFWTDTLRLHEVIQSSVSPATALSVGLKVDATALPADFLTTRNLNDPATTVELIKLNAVVGLVGRVRGTQLKSVGITCAICHSTVDNSVAPGIGNRLDGWPNRALWQHPPYFHDGSAATLDGGVNHYNTLFALGLTTKQKADLVEYLKSL